MMPGVIPSAWSYVLSHTSPLATDYCALLSTLEPARPAPHPVSNPFPSKSPSLPLTSLNWGLLSLLQSLLPQSPVPGMTSDF